MPQTRGRDFMRHVTFMHHRKGEEVFLARRPLSAPKTRGEATALPQHSAGHGYQLSPQAGHGQATVTHAARNA